MGRLCLVMIVRDEEEWLPACLDSALELGVDSWLVADTGSVDGTRELVVERLGDLPGRLIEFAWEGNADARSRALRAARGSAELLLMLDADMRVYGELPEGPPWQADSWLVTIDGAVEYVLPLLVRGDRDWHYRGVTHSYLHSDDGGWVEAMCGLRVEDRRPGGWRPEKAERDRELLEAELERNPLDARSSFYLAQTYEDLGRVGDALREYGRRALLGGYHEERFMALLRRARLLCELDDAAAAIGACLEAWQERPARAEPLYHAARRARRSGWHHQALMFARQAAAMRRPPDRLFVDTAVYEWAAELELGLAELRTGAEPDGVQRLLGLRARGCLPAAHAAWVDEVLAELPSAAAGTMVA